ncbi:hypothetical protein [Capnocytophaga sp.]|nr:hypothetical protein [Capnocytophaga sp.]MDO5105010.1 hypothetical protein [Capnocytophaga sp.]
MNRSKQKKTITKTIFIILIYVFCIVKAIDAAERFMKGWNSVNCHCSKTQ